MELTKQAILDSKHIINGLDGYSLIVSKIEGNANINPDIAIEACKSLIEGLSKKSLELLSKEYNTTKSLRNLCDTKLPKLIRTAFDEVYKKSVEADLHYFLYNLIEKKTNGEQLKSRIEKLVEKSSQVVQKKVGEAVVKISVIRDNRGDISHGRIYPKKEESSVHLAKSIVSITDGICSFMVTEMAEQYQEKLKEDKKLVFDDLEEFNEWLDEKLNVLSVKVDFSKQLYLNAYDKYEEFYYIEFLETKAIEEEQEEVEPTDIKEETALKQETVVEKPEPEKQEKLSFEEWFQEQLKKPSKLSPEEAKELYEQHFGKLEETKKEPVVLVNTFDEKTFWTKKRNDELANFAQAHNMKQPELKEFINRYYFTEKEPRRDEVEKVLVRRLSLKERASTINALTERIIDLAIGLKKLKEV